MNRYDIIVVGSGLGGLLCANLLTREGFSVCVLEKQQVAGGCLQNFKRFGHSFDTGVHYIGSMDEGQALHHYWKYFGLTGKLDLRRMDPDCFDLVAFPDGEYPMAQGFPNFIRRLQPYFPGSEQLLDDYASQLKSMVRSFPLYNLEIPGEHREDPIQTRKAYDFLKAMAASGQGSNSAQAGCSCELSAVLAGNSFLYCGDREKTPLHQYALVNHSYISSAWRLNGGSRQIADLLVQSIHSGGGTVRTRKEVRKISLLQNKYLVNTADGDDFLASMVISDVHPAASLQLLDRDLTRKSFRTRLESLENSVSSFCLYLALKPGTVPYLNHNIHYHASCDVWNETRITGDDWPVQYMLYTPPVPGQGAFASTMIILAYMQYSEVEKWRHSHSGKRETSYGEFRADRARRLMDLAERKFPQLSSQVAGMEISTPLTWRDYTGTPEGSMYGIEKSPGRHPENLILPRTKIPNFYYTGQSVNLPGIPGVTIGAVLTCAEILGTSYILKKIKDAV